MENLVNLFSKRKERGDKVYVSSETDYYHYNCNNENDNCWGCAYRCLQMIVDNMKKQDDSVASKVPKILDIQKVLAQVGCKLTDKDIGSQTWIEPPDLACYLEKELFRKAKSVRIKASNMLKTFPNQLKKHFETHKTPVMIDDSIKAYVINGVKFEKNGNVQVLLFDPHFCQNYVYQDFVNNVAKGVSWKNISTLFDKNIEWMVAFPTLNKIKTVQI